MFPLHTKIFPASAAELEKLLNESLREVLVTRADPVRVRDRNYPALEEIAIDLSGAQVRPNPPPPRLTSGPTSAALQVDVFQLRGDGVTVGPASIDLSLHAVDMQLQQGKDARDEIVVTLQSAREGRLEVSTSKADIERAISELARREAGKQGISVEDVRLDLRPSGARALETVASIRARKMFFSTTVRITARLEIDEQLNARVSNLNCAGEGAIGSLACGFLQPHLQRVDGRTIPLMTLSLGEVRLRDVQLAVGDRLSVQAEFGA